jgi:hypothetical protein
VKKLRADTLHWDASYKEPKHLCQHRGNALFKGLMTGVNQIGEVRLQFHVVTDSKDQVVRPLDDFLGTVEAYGQPKPRLLWTDNVVADGDFFTDKLGLPTIEEGVEEEESVLPIAVVGDGECKYSNQTREINTNVEAMHCSLGPEGRVLSVDAEWAVRTDARGQVNGAGRVAVIQFAYILPGGEQTMALVSSAGRQREAANESCESLRGPHVALRGPVRARGYQPHWKGLQVHGPHEQGEDNRPRQACAHARRCAERNSFTPEAVRRRAGAATAQAGKRAAVQMVCQDTLGPQTLNTKH